MKLNHDCVRTLLIYLENNLSKKSNSVNIGIKLSDIPKNEVFVEFSQEEIFYSADKLIEAKYITVKKKEVSSKLMIITDITWIGHDYLNSIRDAKVWGEVKEKTKSMGSVALEIIKCLAIEATKMKLGIGN